MSDYEEDLEDFILQVCTVPLSNFIATDIFYTSEFRLIHPDLFRICLDLCHLKFYNLSLRGYIKFYDNRRLGPLPYWCTTFTRQFSTEYIPLEVSKVLLYRLLIFQYDDTCNVNYLYMPGDEIRHDFGSDDKTTENNNSITDSYNINSWHTSVFGFINELTSLLDRKRGSCNTDAYIGSERSGVDMFVNLLSDYMISYGNIQAWKTSVFPVTNCRLPRILFFDEPEFCSSSIPHMHKLFSGQAFDTVIMRDNRPEHVKIIRTPVILSSRNDLEKIRNFSMLNNHIRWHKWKDASHIITKDLMYKRLHPLALNELFKDFENV